MTIKIDLLAILVLVSFGGGTYFVRLGDGVRVLVTLVGVSDTCFRTLV